MKYKNLMAKALYDNVPETPEELAFRKGDILTVIEQNTGGLEGWWLCSLHGRQGIAPGNRLKLLIGPMFDSQSPQQRPHTPQGPHQGPPAPQSAQPEGPYQLPPAHDVYQVPQPQRGPPGADAPHSKVVTPIRVGQSYSYSPSQNASQDLYDVPPVRPQGVYDIPPGRPLGYHGSSGAQGVYDTPPLGHADPRMQGVYDTPPASQGVSGVSEEGNYDFPQPLRVRPEGIYDVPPPSLARAAQCPQPTYDYPASSETPPRTAPSGPGEGIYDVPVSQSAAGGGSLYDIPRGTQQPHRDRSKGVYDVPPLDASRSPAEVTERVNRLSFSSTGSSMSTSSSSSSSSVSSPADVRLALDLDSAVQTLGRLLQNLEASVLALRSLTASSRWRTHAYVEHHGNEVRAGLEQVRAALADFVVFGRGALALAALVDPVLHAKLRRQLQRLDDSQQILQQTHHALDASGWALGATATTGRHGDELERFIMVARTVPDDAKQLASTVGGSAELLFRRAPVEGITHPFPPPAPEDEGVGGPTKPFPVPQEKTSVDNGEKCVKSWMEDYDYVHLQGKEEFERQQKELLEKENLTKQSRDTLEHEQLKQLKQLEQEVIKPVENDITQWISHQNSTGSTSSPSGSTSSPSDSTSSSTSSSVGGGAQLCGRDRQLLAFYAEQCERHFVTLLNAVDAFFSCVAAGQPPRVFVAHGKFVILSAHKLVFIGDTLSRQAATPDLASRMIHYSDALCHMLKTVVGATKMAALRYPSTGAVQEMVDRVTDLSHHAQQFKAQLCHMAGPGCH